MAVLTAVVSDLAITAAKLSAFAFSHFSVMLAERIHSLVDAGSGALLVLGAHLSKRPADEAHPFGYGKEACEKISLVSNSGQTAM